MDVNRRIVGVLTLTKTNIAPARRPGPQKETHLPNPAVQVRAVSFREGSLLISTFPHTNYRRRFFGVASKLEVFFSNSKTTENIRVSGGQGNALEGFWYEQEQRY